jgi:hypothetical protein
MQINVEVPKAFSVRDENELYAFRHLLARMNPQLHVTQVATGVHVRGGCTVFWGLVHLADQVISEKDLKDALAEAGFDLDLNGPIQNFDTQAAAALPWSDVSRSPRSL